MIIIIGDVGDGYYYNHYFFYYKMTTTIGIK